MPGCGSFSINRCNNAATSSHMNLEVTKITLSNSELHSIEELQLSKKVIKDRDLTVKQFLSAKHPFMHCIKTASWPAAHCNKYYQFFYQILQHLYRYQMGTPCMPQATSGRQHESHFGSSTVRGHQSAADLHSCSLTFDSNQCYLQNIQHTFYRYSLLIEVLGPACLLILGNHLLIDGSL